MLDESMNTSQSPSASPLDKPPTVDVDRKLTDLLTQTNQLLQIIITLLQKQDTLEIPAEKPVFSSDNWLDEWTKVVNRAFESSMPNDVCRVLQQALDQHHQPLEIIHFNDAIAYEQDRSYALFARSDMGSCFLVRSPTEGEPQYAAFPYPGSATWFVMGRNSVKVLYQMYGATDGYAPRIRIEKPATMRLTGEVNAQGYPVLALLTKGTLIAQ